MNRSAILIIALLLSAVSLATTASQEKRADAIVAIVNDEIITYGELVSKIKEGLRGIESSNLSRRQKEKQKQQLMKIGLRHLIDEKLTLQEAKRYNIKISEETVRKQVEKEFKSKGKKFDSGEVDLTNLMRSQLTLQELFQKKAGYSRADKRRAAIDTWVAPMEIRHYYKKNIKDFTKESKIKTRIITLFYSKNGGRAQTLKKAEAIVKQLREQADFAEMARLYSNDPYAKSGGTWPRIESEEAEEGIWDFFGKGEALYEEVEDIAFDMKEGEISEPIPVDSELYCQIVKIEAVKPGSIAPFTEVQEPIRRRLRYEKVVAALTRMKKRLRREAFIWPPDIFSN